MATAQKGITKVCLAENMQLEQAEILSQEYSDIHKNPLDGMRISLPSERDTVCLSLYGLFLAIPQICGAVSSPRYPHGHGNEHRFWECYPGPSVIL